MCVSKVQHMTGRKTGFFSVFDFSTNVGWFHGCFHGWLVIIQGLCLRGGGGLSLRWSLCLLLECHASALQICRMSVWLCLARASNRVDTHLYRIGKSSLIFTLSTMTKLRGYWYCSLSTSPLWHRVGWFSSCL